jgi:uncharacterized membrane protein (DUF106 family)
MIMVLDVSTIPLATLSIMLIAVAISFMNMALNRFLISRMVGWHEYKSMQQELAEYKSQQMQAMRTKDTKLLEKLKKKKPQMDRMQIKMSKPQLLLLPITFIYFIIWPILIGFYPNPVAYVPGFGPQPFFIWYLICSFFFGTLATKVVGITPIA